MSAAEKLQTLVEEFWEDTAPSGHEAPVEIIHALPQIVAVVEAAELLRDRLDCPGYVMDALAALEEAL